MLTTQAGSANAQELIFDISPDVLAGNTSPTIAINFVNGTTNVFNANGTAYIAGNVADGSFVFGGRFTYVYAPVGDTMAGFVGPGVLGAAAVQPSVLASSFYVTAGLNFAGRNNFAPTYGNFANLDSNFETAQNGFLGLRFTTGGALHYGWVGLSTTGGVITLKSFGWNATPGGGVSSHVGVPEPSSMMLLATGAAGIGMFRRRRKAA